ncbi:cation diffusion facilitator 1 [Colletotrichum cuscutae]|uniref:Cation diffusion facilitator 1 n=1 Tax=Colletotrichum cuscutae TaxID=1209917 RepID=A0AAI9XNJ8_9PEZI|nr:cation diffusion facilitator 1 [Colletotrichum cuscutae]
MSTTTTTTHRAPSTGIDLANLSPNNDPESRSFSSSEINDPYNLGTHIKSDADIVQLKSAYNTNKPRNNSNTTRRRFIHHSFTRGGAKDAKLQDFYRAQNDKIRSYLKSVDDHEREAKETQGDNNLKYQIAVKGSLAANVILSALQLYAAITSGSLSLFTTMADSVFDPLSGVLLLLSHRAVKKVDTQKYPSGKSRISTAGNIVFSFIMFSVSLVLIVMSARDLAAGSEEETNEFHFTSVIAVAIAFGTKFCLWLYCWSIKDIYSQVEILWRDHRNDLFINGFGIFTFSAGSKIKWWIDPMGAILLSFLIAGLWLRTAYEEFQLLIGVSAEPEFLQLITYIAMTHSPEVKQIDTVRAYHSGPRYIVEIDVVMDRHERLEIAHDVAEALQIKIEKLPGVERAFVHVDYETDHKPVGLFGPSSLLAQSTQASGDITVLGCHGS